ncbi:hypothetical protein niasHT_030847 [Heterodera trifolii]|uniref:Uncharacterized protein n=1 Tax=Heterodera trifolii TaxID=157864 RepID=A0ABD2HQA6_9BILA
MKKLFSGVFIIALLQLLLMMANFGHGAENATQGKSEKEEKPKNDTVKEEGVACFTERDTMKWESCPPGTECMESKCFNGIAYEITKGCTTNGNGTCEMEKTKCEAAAKGGKGRLEKCTVCATHFCNDKLRKEDKLKCYEEQLVSYNYDDSSLRTCLGDQCTSLLCIYVRANNDTAFNITRTCATGGNPSCEQIAGECVASGGKPSGCKPCTEFMCNNMHKAPSKEQIMEWWNKRKPMTTTAITGTAGEGAFDVAVPPLVPIVAATFGCFTALQQLLLL